MSLSSSGTLFYKARYDHMHLHGMELLVSIHIYNLNHQIRILFLRKDNLMKSGWWVCLRSILYVKDKHIIYTFDSFYRHIQIALLNIVT